MTKEFSLRYTEDVKPFHARFTREAESLGIQEFVVISTGKQRKLFKADINKRASDMAVFVRSDTFDIPESQPVQVECATKQQYRFYRILHDKNWRLATLGLIASAISAVITASLAVGKIQPLFLVSAGLLSFAMWSALVLQIGGAALLYWKGLMESE